MFFLFWIIVIGFVLLYKNREYDEDLLVLKLIGYYILGSFNFNLNGLILPLGFIISLFMRPGENRTIKRGASIFGLIMMIIGYIF
jgi:hypothetical protein